MTLENVAILSHWKRPTRLNTGLATLKYKYMMSHWGEGVGLCFPRRTWAPRK